MPEIQVAVAMIVIEVIIAILTVAVSYSIVKKEIEANRQIAQEFGDLAGQQAARRYEEAKDARMRIITLRVLLNEIQRIRELARLNTALSSLGPPQAIAPMPTEIFRTALLSRESSLYPETPNKLGEVSPLLTQAMSYLIKADIINYHNDTYVKLISNLARGVGGVAEQKQEFIKRVIDESLKMLEILNQLEESIKSELTRKSP